MTAAALGCAGAADPGRHALAVELLRDLRAALADDGDARGSVRYPAGVPAVAYPVDPSGRVGAGSEVRCVDLSAGGARLECAADVPTEHLYLRFPGHPAAPRVGLLCAVVRRAEPGPGHFELGCRFAAG